LRFDIDPEQFLLTGAVVVQDVDCESP